MRQSRFKMGQLVGQKFVFLTLIFGLALYGVHFNCKWTIVGYTVCSSAERLDSCVLKQDNLWGRNFSLTLSFGLASYGVHFKCRWTIVSYHCMFICWEIRQLRFKMGQLIIVSKVGPPDLSSNIRLGWKLLPRPVNLEFQFQRKKFYNINFYYLVQLLKANKQL